MGRSIVRDPQVFLFDEPLSNLDAKLRGAMRAEIKSLHRRLATTTVYVTHDQVEAMTMADRIVVMNGGRIEQMGRPLDLYDDPKSIFVAGFIGSPSMNLLDGRFIERNGATLFEVDGGVIFAVPRGISVAADKRATYGIRPEYIALAASGQGVKATVTVVEPLGAETQVTAKIGSQTVVVVVKERVQIEPDQVIWLAPQIEKACLFDDKGARIEPELKTAL